MTADHTGASSTAHLQMLGLQLTYRCNAACRACAFDCSPVHTLDMPLDSVRSIIAEARNLKLAPVIGLTGGEPFYDHDRLIAVAEIIHSGLGFKLSISTNCFWACNRSTALDILSELSALGLVALLISVDDFHQAFVPLERVGHAIEAAMERGIECILQSMETRNGLKASDWLAALDIQPDDRHIRSVPIACEPVGRAKRDVPEKELVKSWKNRAGTCSMLSMWVIGPDGRVFPCCGTAAQVFSGTGNTFEEPLTNIIHRANTDPLFNALAAWGGPYLPFKILARKGMPHFAAGHYVSACHACHCLFTNQEALERVRDDLAPRQAEMIAARLISRQNQNDWRLDPKTDTYAVPAAW